MGETISSCPTVVSASLSTARYDNAHPSAAARLRQSSQLRIAAARSRISRFYANAALRRYRDPGGPRRKRRNLTSRIGMSKARAASDIFARPARSRSSDAISCHQPLGRQLRLRQQAGGSARCQRRSIVALMIVRRRRQWNEDRRLARRRDLANRAGARAAHQQVGARKRSRHVVDEGRHLRRDHGIQVNRLRLFVILFAGLMNHVDVRHRFHQLRQGIQHGLVDGMRALAAAEDQQRGPSHRSARRGTSKNSRRTGTPVT